MSTNSTLPQIFPKLLANSIWSTFFGCVFDKTINFNLFNMFSKAMSRNKFAERETLGKSTWFVLKIWEFNHTDTCALGAAREVRETKKACVFQ